MCRNSDSELTSQTQDRVEFPIRYTEEAFVSEEYFEGSRTISHNFSQLTFGLLFPLRYRHMESVVAGTASCSFRLPQVVAFEPIIHARRTTHFDVGRRS